MSFAWPWLFMALPLPWLLRMLLPPVPVAAALHVPHLVPTTEATPSRAGVLPWIAALAWLSLVIAVARPQIPDDTVPYASSVRNVMLAFDVSMSMATADLQHENRRVERLDGARLLADAFLARRQGDRVGLVVFGSQAYLHTPLSIDLHAVRSALGGVQTGLAGRETALGDAIALSVKYLKDLPENARVLVLLTDGANTGGTLTPERAAWLAQRHGVKIHAAGIGGASGLDETTLKSIAAQTGGTYTRATDGAAMSAFFEQLDRVEAIQMARGERPLQELYVWPLAFACLLAAAIGWHGRREGVA